MPIYLNGRKYVGAYYNGRRVNGYYNGIKLFQYDIPINLTFAWANSYGNESSKTVKVLLKPHMNYSANDLFNAFNAKLTGYGQIPDVTNDTSNPGSYSVPNLGEFHTTENYLVDPSGNNLTSDKITLNMNNNLIAIQLSYNGQMNYKSVRLQANQAYDLQNDIMPNIGGNPYSNTHLTNDGSITLDNYGHYTFNEGIYTDTTPITADFALNTVDVTVNYVNQFFYSPTRGGNATATLTLPLGTYTVSDIENKFPIMGNYEVVGDTGMSDPGSGYSNEDDIIDVGWDTSVINIDILPDTPTIMYDPIKEGYDPLLNVSGLKIDIPAGLSAFDKVVSAGNPTSVQLPWGSQLGTSTLNGKDIKTTGLKPDAETTWNNTLNGLTVTPTLGSDLYNAWVDYCDNTLYSQLDDPDIGDSDQEEQSQKNIIVNGEKKFLSVVLNNYIVVPIWDDDYVAPIPSSDTSNTVDNTVNAVDPNNNIITTWKNVSGQRNATYTPEEWAQQNGETSISTGDQTYNVDTNPDDLPLQWGNGGSVMTVPYDPASSPAPTPSIPSSIHLYIDFDNYWTHQTVATSNGIVNFTPNPYRGNSYYVTYAEICYFYNYNTWPNNETSTYYVSASDGTNYFIYNPLWQLPEHGQHAAGSVSDIGDKSIDLSSYSDGSTISIPVTQHKDRSWDAAMID